MMLAIGQSYGACQVSDRNNSNPPDYCFRSQTTTFVPSICYCNSKNHNSGTSTGRIKRLVLSEEGRTKLNEYQDKEFYGYPRFVTHVDNDFTSTLTNLYREILRPEMEILDLMSSWVSHLPDEVQYKRVVGHGLNAQELARNPRFDHFFVKDLNEDQELHEFDDGLFDAVLCTVSVQYLQQPEKVFAEIFRVLKPGGVCVVSFSNRMFYEKAIRAWRDGNMNSRVQLVVQYLQCVEGFTQPQVITPKHPLPNNSNPSKFLGFLLSGSSSDPFYAVISHKNIT